MPTTKTNDPKSRLRRRRRALVAVPAGIMAWAVLTGLPLGAQEMVPGTMRTKIVTLTDPQGRPALAATASVGGPMTIDVEDGTQAVAASWLGTPEGVVSVRGETSGAWSEWTPLAGDPEEQPDDAPRTAAGMAWFGSTGVDTIEVRLDSGPLNDLQVQPMRYEEPRGSLLPAGASAGATAAQPTILPRSSYTSKGWASANSGCSTGPLQASSGIKFAVVHHTVNANTYSASDVPAMLAAIYTFHTGTNGWCDTAYNFIIDRFGRIWEGRSGGIDKAIIGGHAAGFNTGSVGVAFLGQYEPGATPTPALPSPEALAAAGKLTGWKLGLHGVSASGTVTVTSGGSNKYPAGTQLTIDRVIGHRDIGWTACPGLDLYDDIGAIRDSAVAAQAGTNPTTTTTAPTTTTTVPPAKFAPFTSASALVTQQYRDVLRREATASDLEFWTSRVGTTWSPEQLIAHLTSSAEADNRVHAVTRLYSAYFLRTPDHSGLNYWLNRRGEGRTITSISSSFAVSSEFTNRYGKLSNGNFVDRVYLNVLGRSADPGGLTYWKTRLDGGMPRGQVMANFSQSSEYIRQTQSGVWVTGTYEAMLQIAAPTSTYTWYKAVLSNGAMSLTAVTGEIYDGSEYRSRFG